MKRKEFVSVMLVIGILCAVSVSCGNNRGNKPSSPQITNDNPTMEIRSVEWETTSKSRNNNAVSNQSNTITSQNNQIGDPKLVKYLNTSVKKDFSYACFPLTEIVNDTKTFSFDFDKDGINENVVIMYSIDKLKVQGNANNKGSVVLDLEKSVLEEIEPEYIQVSAYDFDDDGVFEMMLSVGDGNLENIHAIYCFNPSTKEYYKEAGAFESQQDITLNGDEIEAPFGSQGFFESFRYSRGRIIEEGDTW